MTEIEPPPTAKKAAREIRLWLEQFATLGGLDQELAHTANFAELRVADIRALVEAESPDHAASVLPEEVVRQRSRGWPDFHPEDFCHRCGHRNITWYVADKAAWEIAVSERPRGDSEILCPSCFALLYEANGGPGVHMWELVQYDPERERGVS